MLNEKCIVMRSKICEIEDVKKNTQLEEINYASKELLKFDF